jgi:hypothetical protein
MKKITLRNLPPEIQRLIKRKALNEDISREEAVIAILRDAELQRIADAEIGIVEARLGESKAF